MKTEFLIAALLALTLAWSVRGATPSGTVRFVTRIDGVVDARVERLGEIWPGSTQYPVDSRFVGQLYFRRIGESAFQAAGVPVAFRDSPPESRGYILDGGEVEFPGTSPGEVIEVKVAAWQRSYSATYEGIKRIGWGNWGESESIQVIVGGGGQPSAELKGLQRFAPARILGIASDYLGPEPTPLVRWVANGHWYQRLEAVGIPFADAQSAAAGISFHGFQGHLVTSGSAEETAFLRSHPELGNNSPATMSAYWIGHGGPSMAGSPPRVTPSLIGGQMAGYFVEFDADPDPNPPIAPGSIEVRLVKFGISPKVLLSWSPQAGVLLERATQFDPASWLPVPDGPVPGSFLEASAEGTAAFFRLSRSGGADGD